MAPPQVNLNEKPPAETSEDPLPEKEGAPPTDTGAVIVTVDRRQANNLSAEQRRQRKRCRVVCCASLSFLLVLMLALGTACIVYRMKHKKKEWTAWCGTKEVSERLPEHVKVDEAKKLIYVKPEHHDNNGIEVLHEYNRRLIAFKNTTAKTCYLDRLDETFEEGYARWRGYTKTIHVHNHTMLVFKQAIDVKVVRHIADVHIFEHCGGKEYEYHWVKEVTEKEIRLHPTEKYIRV